MQFSKPLNAAALLIGTSLPGLAYAEDVLNSGDTAWMITATALVLIMTIPGLSLFTPEWFAARTSFPF